MIERGVQTRDHTERMLSAMGARVRASPRQASVWPVERLGLAAELELPGDFSSAAPFLVAAALLAGSEVRVHGANVNSTRTGLLDVLERMGARVTVFNRRSLGGEPAGDVEVRPAPLVAVTVEPAEVPRLIDELPLLALAATNARGRERVRGAAELRVKESDRIATVDEGLRALGARSPSGRTARCPGRAGRAPRRRPSTRPGTTGSRCSARSPASRRRGGRGRGRGGRGCKLPRLLASSRRVRVTGDDRRDRRARGRGEEHGRPAARRAAWLPLPRHRRDVPRADVARAAARRCASTTEPALGDLARRASRRVRRGAARVDRGDRRDGGHPPHADRPARARRRPPPRGARGDARAPARARRATATS